MIPLTEPTVEAPVALNQGGSQLSAPFCYVLPLAK